MLSGKYVLYHQNLKTRRSLSTKTYEGYQELKKKVKTKFSNKKINRQKVLIVII